MKNNSTSHFFNRAQLARWFGFSIVAVLMLDSMAHAQRFQLEDYLKRKDANQNGRVDPEEMSDNTRGFLTKMGFDTDKLISISKIVSKANDDRNSAESTTTSTTSKTSRTRKVAGFGVEKKETATVSRFSASGSATTASSATSNFSESVMRQVSDTLNRYDRNKDGSLDREELQGARWGSPPPEQSDTNKDGVLTKDELANRYASREQYYRSSTSSSSSGRRDYSSSRTDSQDRGRGSSDTSRGRSSSNYSSSGSSRSTFNRSSSPTSSTSTVASTSSADSQAKYEKYADSLISQYDEDKDGKLSADESKKMRRPPVGADADKDGFITKGELLDSLSPKPSTSAGDVKDDKKSTRTSRDRGDGSSASRATSSRPGSSSSFEKLDANVDRAIQMHEFATKWDDKTVDEFYSKDKNGDGVITLSEWTGKN